MKFHCEECNAKYQIADEKIIGKTLRMKCRRCSHAILVRGPRRSEVPESIRPESLPVLEQQKEWHAAIQDVPVGPMTQSELEDKIESATVERDALVWREGMDDWKPLSSVPEFVSFLAKHPPKAEPTKPSPIRSPGATPPPPTPLRRASTLGETGSRPAVVGANLVSPVHSQNADRTAAVGNVIPIRGGGSSGTQTGAGLATAAYQEPDTVSTSPEVEPETSPENDRLVLPDSNPPSSVAEVEGSGDHDFDDGLPSLLPGARTSSMPAERIEEPSMVTPSISPDAFASSLPPSPLATPQKGTDPTKGTGSISDEVAVSTASAMPGFTEGSQATRLPSQPVPSSSERKGLPVGAWIAIVGAASFGLVLATLVADHLFDPPQPQVVIVHEPTGNQPANSAELEIPPEAEPSIQPGEDNSVVPTNDPNGSQASNANADHTTSARHEPTAAERLRQRQWEEARRQQQAANQQNQQNQATAAVPALEDEADFGRLHVPGQHGNTSGPAGGEGLNAQQLGSVVSRNRPSLQRCYERAIRGMPSPPRVRLDVQLSVGASGGVTTVSANGTPVGNLSSCIESAVRRWRFPSAGAASATRFPVVFQAGS